MESQPGITAEKFATLTIDEVVELFNPANADTLPKEVLAFMQTLSTEQIAALAKAYPNGPRGNSYLKLKDTTASVKQLYPLSTWENLHHLRAAGGQDKYVALTFTSRFKEGEHSNTAKVVAAPVQDLQKAHLVTAPGINVGATAITTAPAQNLAPITPENEPGKPQGTEKQPETGEAVQSTQTTGATAVEPEKEAEVSSDQHFEDLSDEAKKATEGTEIAEGNETTEGTELTEGTEGKVNPFVDEATSVDEVSDPSKITITKAKGKTKGTPPTV